MRLRGSIENRVVLLFLFDFAGFCRISMRRTLAQERNSTMKTSLKLKFAALALAFGLPLHSSPVLAGLYDYEWFATTSPGSTVRVTQRLNGFAINHSVFRAGEGPNRATSDYKSLVNCGVSLEISKGAREWWKNWRSSGYGVSLEKNRSPVCGAY
jgi:hypothetical protein